MPEWVIWLMVWLAIGASILAMIWPLDRYGRVIKNPAEKPAKKERI